MAIVLDPKKTLFVHVHWMKYYEGRDEDEPFSGGQSRDGSMEDYNFFDYQGTVFGGFWPGRRRKDDDRAKEVNLSRLGARGEVNAKGVTVLFFAPHPKDGALRFVGWYDDAIVYRGIQVHPDDDQWYNITVSADSAHLIPHRARTTALRFTDWWRQGAYRFGSAAPAVALTAVQREMRKHA